MFEAKAYCGTSRVGWGVSNTSSIAPVSDPADWLATRPGAWIRTYVHQALPADFSATVAAVGIRFSLNSDNRYLVLTLVLPLLQAIAVHIFGRYEWRFFSTCADEFRSVFDARPGLRRELIIRPRNTNTMETFSVIFKGACAY